MSYNTNMSTPAQRRAVAAKYATKKKKAPRKPTTYAAKTQRKAVIPRALRTGSSYERSAGYQAGSRLGGNIGGLIGYGASKLLPMIMGFGDYQVRANSIMGGVYDPPELHNASARTVVVRHREYLGDIIASSAFSLASYPINPGLFSTFPWLSQIGEAFEEYRFTGIVFEFKTLSADYTTASSAALGYVIMSTQYNVLNPNFADKLTMENYEFSNSGKPSDTFIHPVECKRSLNPVSELFVRTGIPTTGDLRLYDHGNFQIATGGNSGTGVLGELWCTFEVEFYKPKLVAALGTELLTDHFYSSSPTNANPFAGAIRRAGSNIGVVLTNTTIKFPADIQDGEYLVNLAIVGTSAALTRPTLTLTNCALATVYQNDTVQYQDNTASTTAIYILNFYVSITASPASIAFASGVYPSSGTAMDCTVTQINSGIIT